MQNSPDIAGNVNPIDSHQQSIGGLNVADGIRIERLADFDENYFRDLNERDNSLHGWLASKNCENVRYFTVLGSAGEKLGIIGVYDSGNDKNVTHTIVDPRYRGMGLAKVFKDVLMDQLGLSFVTLTINYDPYAPDDPSRTNVSSMKATEKLPGVQRVDDPRLAEIQKAKFVYRKRNEIFDRLSEDATGILIRIKEKIDEGGLEGKDWGEIRREYGIPLRRIGDKDLILRTLGTSTLMQYFSALGGEAKPYKFELPLVANDISEYLSYELSDAPAPLILALLRQPISQASLNILISHCVHIPRFTNAIMDEFPNEDFDLILRQILHDHPKAEQMLSRIFDNRRIAYLREFDKYNENNPAPQELLDEFKKYEQSLFGKSAR